MTEEKLNKTVGFVSLGCDKNRVDTESIITTLYANGFKTTGNINDAQIIIINTCAFLKSARDEALATMLEMLDYKKTSAEKIIVAGCLCQMDDKLKEKYPEIDAFITPKDYGDIAKIIYGLYGKPYKNSNGVPDYRKITTPGHFAYLKIAEGCDNSCSYCTIPKIKGPYVSEPIESLVKTATILAEQGVKELILVAQDTTRYGLDLYKKQTIAELLKKLSEINGIEWIRLHYCYPEMLTPAIINEIATNPKVVKYLDIPFQHVSTKVLKSMNRAGNEQSVKLIVEMLRSKIPEIVLRSTFIVGFPGETNEDFKLLLKFLKEYKLDAVGFFAYSNEEGTPSFEFDGQLSQKEKQKRLEAAQKIQSKIAFELNQKFIGATQKVLCDGFDQANGLYYGRNYGSSPDVDFVVYINGKCSIGDFVSVKITDATDEYLIGEIA
ncbi:MAG: 30S ribosomal protein S12 methylthiotransferase RimO [Christensenellaceae bacterium]|nr:30S ribosomal protein S12 methylthiotransferase RimO [Christensenellaceae bacterium]